MYIIDVIPLALIPRNQDQILSYFYSEELAVGSVVETSFHFRKIKCIVVGCGTIKSRKLDFKKMADFELKNISKVINREPQVSEQQLKIAQWISNYYYAPLGICLKHILPPFWGKQKYRSPRATLGSRGSPSVASFQPDNHEKHIKHELNSGKQVFLMVAENMAGKYFLEKYAEFNPVCVNSGLKNKQYFEIWKKVQTGETKLIIGTRIGLFLPFNNLGLIIVDDESNDAYKSDMTPRYYAPDLTEFVAGLYGANTVISSIFPRIETLFKLKINFTDSNKEKTELINMISEIKSANFSIFSRELKEILLNPILNQQPKNKNQKLILFVPRRGHANYVVCQTCGKTIKCPNCNVNLVVHQQPSLKNFLNRQSVTSDQLLVCHHCDHSRIYPKQCPSCGDHRLKPIGIGIEKVETELKKYYNRANLACPKILRLDGDSVKNETEELETINSFLKTEPAILLATQMLFSYKHLLANLISKPITGIISADSLINIPDFRSEESLFRQFMIIAAISKKIILQTNNPEDSAISLFSRLKISEFVNLEINNREILKYPPFAKFTKITYKHFDAGRAGREAHIAAEKIRQIIKQNKFGIEAVGPYPAFISKEKGLFIWNILLKYQSAEIKTRNEILRVVSGKGWTIDVDPRSVV